MTAALATLAVAVTVSMAVAAAPAQAASLCGNPPASGWLWNFSLTDNSAPGVEIQVWRNGDAVVYRFANTVANGKSNLLARASVIATGGTDKGSTAGIGSAPSGGWCSDSWSRSSQTGYFAISYWIGGTSYGTKGYCRRTGTSDLGCEWD
jgi:hypothetical protein